MLARYAWLCCWEKHTKECVNVSLVGVCDRVVSEFVQVHVRELCVCHCACVWYVRDYVSVRVYVCV